MGKMAHRRSRTMIAYQQKIPGLQLSQLCEMFWGRREKNWVCSRQQDHLCNMQVTSGINSLSVACKEERRLGWLEVEQCEAILSAQSIPDCFRRRICQFNWMDEMAFPTARPKSCHFLEEFVVVGFPRNPNGSLRDAMLKNNDGARLGTIKGWIQWSKPVALQTPSILFS